MMKRLISIIGFFAYTLSFAQVPDGYYSNSQDKTGKPLMEALYNTIKNHTEITYTDLWTAFYTTDMRDNGKVWDMYSTCSYTFGEDQDTGTGGTTECDVYNREHSFPRSWFGGAVSPMNTDLFHIYPTDKKVNAVRADYPYGTVSSPSYTSSNGCKLGQSSVSGFSGVVFEPANDYKGDFARSYFYMATRYFNLISSWNSDMLNSTQHPAFATWALNVLMQWHNSDPVSIKEINRNNTIYSSFQNNRNPYIDNPHFVQKVWSTSITPVVITSTPSTSAFVNMQYSYQLAANQGSGGAITFSVLKKPNWLSFGTNGDQSFLNGTPAINDIGIHYIVVMAKNSNSHTIQQFEIEVKESGSWSESLRNERITVFPNPAFSHVTLETGTTKEGVLTIQNIIGTVVLQTEFPAGTAEFEVDVEGLTNGTYLIYLYTNNTIRTGKLIIKK